MSRTRQPLRCPWPRNRIRASVLSILLLLICSAPSATADADKFVFVGIVETIRGLSQDYALRRDGVDLRLRICDQVQNGDLIVVRRDDGEVRVRLTTGELVTVTQQSDQPISAQGAPAKVFSNLLANLGGLVTSWHDFVELNFSVRGEPARMSDGRPLELPLVPLRGGAISAGQRSLALAWLGGTPPFRVSLVESAGGREVFAAEGVSGRKLPLRPLALPTGAYTLRLLDGAGQLIAAPIEAVPDGQIPRPAAEPALAGVPQAWRATALAGWLAQQDSGRWLLEAFLAVTPIGVEFNPAQTLADLLAAGGPVGSR